MNVPAHHCEGYVSQFLFNKVCKLNETNHSFEDDLY